MSEKSQWGSKLGFILASAGSAIGLGAVWKFPYTTAANGGGGFLLVFLISTILIGFQPPHAFRCSLLVRLYRLYFQENTGNGGTSS